MVLDLLCRIGSRRARPWRQFQPVRSHVSFGGITVLLYELRNFRMTGRVLIYFITQHTTVRPRETSVFSFMLPVSIRTAVNREN